MILDVMTYSAIIAVVVWFIIFILLAQCPEC